MPSILTTIALTLAVAGLPSDATAAFPGKPGRIAYNVAASGVGAWIYTISPDGTRVRRVMTVRADAFAPSWSADGRRLVFVMGNAIWRVNGDGNRLVRVTRGNVSDPESPTWSPSGKRVVFSARSSARNFDIYVVDVNGRHLRRLTKNLRNDEHPSWSPDGKRIAWSRSALGGNVPPTPELWTMAPDGSRQHRLGSGGEPDWSPYGKRIAFTRAGELWISGATGQNSMRIVSGEGMVGDPAWSPDGRQIVFWSDRASDEATKGDLYVTTSDGEVVQRLTNEPELWHFAPSWQPLSQHVR